MALVILIARGMRPVAALSRLPVPAYLNQGRVGALSAVELSFVRIRCLVVALSKSLVRKRLNMR